ncbi:MAG: TetR/AcrR family transcriptional regulator [Spirochaetes bacterium]|nr:TetR/AcrR family transcriptional regulator [Spirochaetota bacterium]
MALKKQTRLEEKKNIIIDVAKRVLIKYGKNATMGDIAAALDMDKSSLYYYFKGIPEILNTVLNKEYYDFTVHMNQLRKDHKHHITVLKKMCKIILEFYYDNLEILQIILARLFPLFVDSDWKEDSQAINDYLESYRQANDFMLEEIKEAVDSGEFKTDFSAEMILQTLRGSIFGICAVWRKHKTGKSTIPNYIDQIFKMYL